MLRLGNYPKRYLEISFFWEILFLFSLENTFSSHFRNNLLWLHTVFAVLYLILTVILLRRHTSQMKGMPRENVSHFLRKDSYHSTKGSQISR